MSISFIQQNIWIFVLLAVWEIVWKGIALWKSARAGHLYWFVALLIVNSAGVFPILYIILLSKKKD